MSHSSRCGSTSPRMKPLITLRMALRPTSLGRRQKGGQLNCRNLTPRGGRRIKHKITTTYYIITPRGGGRIKRADPVQRTISSASTPAPAHQDCILPCARHLRVVFEHAQSTSCLAYVGLTSLGRDSCALGRNSSSTRLFTLSASFRCNLEAMDTDTSPSRARLLRSLQGSCTPGFQNMCPGHSTLASEKMAP